MTRWVPFVLTACAVLLLSHGSASAQASRTPWGDPDLQGSYTNSDESLIPMERPDTLSGKSLSDISAAELEKLNEQRNDDRVEADKQRWELRSPLHWFENHNPRTAAPGSSSIRRTARFRRRPPRRRLARRRVRRREKVAAMRTRTKIAACTIAASPGACPAR